ncbi:uncharacterized protein LOC111242478 [Vigna radiata var. radiata]|uniref:Uncharacterized protein LOC111242478 n=1 Tax=Vigna radiata var. radiata TaxID=3916 RepID=A0A3Q0FD95_VIGRR|nr:uncharacterized protein LOC111242478 [Vigna radiata var. radiata]
MDVYILKHFVPPQLSIYNGTTDPDDHVQAFSTRMAFRFGNRAIWCRAFSLSLEGEALEWVNSLPPNSIQSFEGLKEMFDKQFASSRAQDPTVFELSNLNQGKDETLKAFVDRKRPKTMEELRERAANEVRVEEMKQAYKKEAQESKERVEGKRPEGQTARPARFKPRELPRGPRFQQYTPLNAHPTCILQEALNINLIPPLKKRPTPPGADNNKHCLYHQNQAHTTEECVTLRDKIEELIRAGQIRQYIKTVSNTTSHERHRSPVRRDDRSRSRRPSYKEDQPRYEKRRSRSRSRSKDRPIRGRINTISGGFARGGPSSSTKKRHFRALRPVNNVRTTKKSMPPITFSDEDFHAPDLDQEDPMIVGFVGERVDTRGYVDLRTRLGTG